MTMANPMGKTDTQTPGVYRRRIGDALVTTINDGFLDLSFEILRGAELDDLQGLMRSAFRDGPLDGRGLVRREGPGAAPEATCSAPVRRARAGAVSAAAETQSLTSTPGLLAASYVPSVRCSGLIGMWFFSEKPRSPV